MAKGRTWSTTSKLVEDDDQRILSKTLLFHPIQQTRPLNLSPPHPTVPFTVLQLTAAPLPRRRAEEGRREKEGLRGF